MTVRVLAIPDHLLACGYSTLDTKSADEEHTFFDVERIFRIGHWCFPPFFLFFWGGGLGGFLGFLRVVGGRNLCVKGLVVWKIGMARTGFRIHFLKHIEDVSRRNRPYSYSHGCTGNEHEREADAGKSFQMQIIPPA